MDGSFHCEVKRVERGLNLHSALEKCAKESGGGKIPYVAHRKNRTEWLVTISGEDFCKMAKAYLENASR